jgi:recombination protein RecT
MAHELILLERQLQAIRPRVDAALGGIMPATRLEQTILVSCERTPKLLDCSPQSVLNAAMTFAVLALPVDGATGQGFMIPFKGQAQAVIGYRGYNTLGARAGLTITAGTVREGDEFSFALGSHAYLEHKPVLGSRSRVVAFWACATARDRPAIISVLSIEDILAVKSRSPGAQRRESPWNDPEVGFNAMGEKTARRRLARSTPLRIDAPSFQQAASMEEAHEEGGKLSWITPSHGVVVEGEPAAQALPFRQTETPTVDALVGGRETEPEKPVVQGSPIEEALRQASEKGTAALQTAWHNLTPQEQRIWAVMKDRHFKPIAQRADKKHDSEREA